MRNGKSYPRCFDPYLRYAISTHFKNFDFFEEQHFKLFFLVEFKPTEPETQTDPATCFEQEMEAAGVVDVEFGPPNGTLYRTLRTSTLAVLKRAAKRIWDKHFRKVELSLPLRPSPVPPKFKRSVLPRPRGSVLLGLLDDGCPFASAQFLRSPASTRALAIWDQDQGRVPIRIDNTSFFGQPLPDFSYGLQFLRDSAGSQIGLDEWIQRHLTPTGSIDEDGCYADAAFTRLKRRELHGAHVMDVLAGRIPTSSRIGPTHQHQDHRDPPNWAVGHDPASSADVVFVQFPESCIDDATGVWLKAYVLDGIQYILSFAGPNTESVIINLSYGPTTGPHDGTALLEEALSALVTQFNGTANNPKLEIFLAVGNSYLAEGHVTFKRDEGQAGQIEWIWRLPPDNPVLCFSEVWMKSIDASGVTVTLTPPGGGAPLPISPVAWGNNTMWQLDVGPTIIAPLINPAPHGDYTIKVTGIAVGAQVDAYVARTDPNLSVLSLAKPSHFVDPKWLQTRSAEADCIYTDGEFDSTGSLVNRYGTLNGIATAKNPSVHVAGGDMLAVNGRKSPYASAGPARGGPRIGPDYALFCDESYALKGVRAGGTRSGVVFRLIGTSTAAPQLARQVMKGTLPSPTHIPSGPRGRERRGGGNIEPP
jgi:hypothetical protein